MNRPLRVKGHSLRRSGVSGDYPDAFAEDGTKLPQGTQYGCARCQCGAQSPMVVGPLARRRWHRDHREKLAGVSWL